MPENYGELLRIAREQHSPPMTAKQLAEKLKVKAPFITDIEKGRRLPSLINQKYPNKKHHVKAAKTLYFLGKKC